MRDSFWASRPQNGVARGIARVVADHSQLADFKHGEILVCDAVDPNMTFVAPLAAGIVERRGGMLIHGAIIARDYGLACVTGVPRRHNPDRNRRLRNRGRLPGYRHHRQEINKE